VQQYVSSTTRIFLMMSIPKIGDIYGEQVKAFTD